MTQDAQASQFCLAAQGPPIGMIAPYAGSGDPNGSWVVCDGRLIDKAVYATFFSAVGHVYNGGVDPGGGMVRIPDKRGRVSRGAINMGTGAGANDNAHSQTARGAGGGEVNHTLSSTESGLPAHGHTVSDSGHSHTAETAHAAHNIPSTDGTVATGTIASGGGFAAVPVSTGGTWSEITFLHTHTIDSSTTGVGVNNASASSAGSAHNNLDPYETDAYIVRII